MQFECLGRSLAEYIAGYTISSTPHPSLKPEVQASLRKCNLVFRLTAIFTFQINPSTGRE